MSKSVTTVVGNNTYTVNVGSDNYNETRVVADAYSQNALGGLEFTIDGAVVATFAPGKWSSVRVYGGER